MNPEWRNRYERGMEVTRQAAQLALRYYDTSLEIEWKECESPVTVADREAEQLLRTKLAESFPDDGFLGEEFGEHQGASGFRWIFDPIDGTRSFVRGIPLWGTLVGLEYKGEQIAGIVDVPTIKHTYHALRGEGAFRNEQRIHVSNVTDLSESMIFYSSMSWFARAGKETIFMEIVRRTQRQRGFGDFYGHMLVAQGSGEAMIEHGVHVWDVAPLKPIVEEAGGRFSDWDGTPSVHRPDVLITNGNVHDEFLALLRGEFSSPATHSARAE